MTGIDPWFIVGAIAAWFAAALVLALFLAAAISVGKGPLQ